MTAEHRPIVLARKPGPLRPLAIDACRIGTEKDTPASPAKAHAGFEGKSFAMPDRDPAKGTAFNGNIGRWPSNLLLSDPALFDEPNPEVVGSGAVTKSGVHTADEVRHANGGNGITLLPMPGVVGQSIGDSGGYSRFFRIPDDDLLGHLTKLVTPPDGVAYDPFPKEGGVITTGDCIEVMAAMEPDSVDAIVTDPPYSLAFMSKHWDAHPTPTAFMAWCEAWGREALRVTRPGGYLLAFGGTRTHHRLVCGLEDAGWIIRDELDWIYASGFPKGKANLKPAHEPIVLARKPGPLQPLAIDACRIGTADGFGGGANGTSGFAAGYEKGDGFAASSVGRWPSNLLLSDPALFDEPNPGVVGSGAVTGDGRGPRDGIRGGYMFGGDEGQNATLEGHWHGDSGGYSRFFIVPKADRADREPVVRGQLTAQPGGTPSMSGITTRTNGTTDVKYPRATVRENAHPTVKPVDLMRHLVRLVTPSGGTVLDPFLGSGSTAIAAELEGFPWLGIEKEPEYVKIAEARLNGTQRGLGLDVPAPTKASPKTHPDLAKHQPKRRAPSESYSGGWPGLEPEEIA
jgi:DNA modification methylase